MAEPALPARPIRRVMVGNDVLMIDQGDYHALLDIAERYRQAHIENGGDDITIGEVLCRLLRYFNRDASAENAKKYSLTRQGRVRRLIVESIDVDVSALLPVFELSALESLLLGDLDVARIPDLFERLPRLHNLDLLNLPRLRQLPPSICTLKNLTCGSFIDIPTIHSLPEDFGNLSRLGELYFYGTPLRRLPSTLGNLKNLDTLEGDCSQLEEFPETFRSLSNLSSFGTGNSMMRCPMPSPANIPRSLCAIYTTQPNLPCFHREMHTACQITSLDVGLVSGSDDNDPVRTFDISQNLKHWKHLDHLTISPYTHYEVSLSSDLSTYCPKLSTLHFYNEETERPPMKINLGELVNVRYVKYLYFDNCILTMNGDSGESAVRMPRLERLIFRGCKTELSALARLDLPCLKELELTHCIKLDSMMLEFLTTKWISQLHALVRLDLSNCEISEISSLTISALQTTNIRQPAHSEQPSFGRRPSCLREPTSPSR